MEEEILEFIKLNDLISYHLLPKTFGMDLKTILKVLNLNINYVDGGFEIFNYKGNSIYFYDKNNNVEMWAIYNSDSRLIKNIHSNGHWEEFLYDDYGRFCGVDSEEIKKTWDFDRFGKRTNEETRYYDK